MNDQEPSKLELPLTAAKRIGETALRAFIDHSADVFLLVDKNAIFQYASPAITPTLGYTIDEQIGLNGFSLIHPDDQARAQELFKELLENPETSLTVEFRAHHKDGSWRWLEATGTNLLAEPSIRAVVINARDITERQQAEETLRQSEAFLKKSQRLAHVGNWKRDLKGDKAVWSDELYHILGFVPGELQNPNYETFLSRVHPDDRDKVAQLMERAFITKQPYEQEFRIVTQDGTEKQVYSTIEIQVDESGAPAAIFGTTQDITERKQMEEALQHSEEKYRTIVDSIDEVIYLVDFAGDAGRSIVRFVSQQTEVILGYRPEEFIQNPGLRLESTHPLDAPSVAGSTQQFVANGQPGSREYRIRHKTTGEYRWIEDRLIPRLNTEGKVIGALGIVRDVTNRKRAQDESRLLQIITASIGDTQAQAPAIRAVLREVCEITDWLIGQAWLPAEDGVQLECSPEWYTRVAGLEYFRAASRQFTFQLDEGIVGRAWSTRRPIWVPDVQGTIDFKRKEAAAAINLNAGMIIPVLAGDEVVAVLEFYIAEPREEDQRLMQMVSAVAVQLGSTIRHKKAEEELHKSEADRREVQRIARIGGWRWHVQSGREEWSDECCQIFGVEPQNFDGSHASLLNLVHSEDRLLVEEALRKAIDHHQPYDTEYRIVWPDGSIHTIHSRGSINYDEAGRPIEIVGTVQDITDRAQVESELRKLSRVTVQTADAVLITDRDGHIEFVNPAFEQLTGYTSNEAIGQTPRILKSGRQSQPYYENMWQIILAGQVFRGVTINCKQNGDLFYEEKVITPLKDERGHITHFVSTGRDITERKRVEAELERYTRQLSALDEMARAVTTTLSLEVVLTRVIDETLALLDADGTSVLLLENKELVFVAVSGAGAASLRGKRIPANSGVAGEVLQTGHSARVRGNADQQTLNRSIETASGYHTQSLIAVPLNLGNKIIGVMEAVHTQQSAFSSDDLSILESAANWSAIAINNARQHAELQRRLQESQALAAISQALNETLDLDRVLQLIAISARRIIPNVEHAVIHLLDESQQALKPVAADGLNERGKPDLILQPGEGIAGQVIKQGHVINIPDTQQDERYVPLGLATDLRSLLVAPVQIGPRRLGTISIQSRAPHAFSAQDEHLMATLGAQAAIAIENARLYKAEHNQRLLAEALRDSATAINMTLDFNEVLNRILANVERVVEHDLSSILLIEPDKQTARVARYRNLAEHAHPAAVVELRLKIAELPDLRQIVKTGRPVIIANTFADPSWVTIPETQWVRSHISAPIVSRSEIVGFLNLDSATPNFFTAQHVESLQTFASQAAMAIDNARLFESANVERKRLRLLYTVGRTLSATLDADVILDRAVYLITESVAGALGEGFKFDPRTNRLHLKTLANRQHLSVEKLDAEIALILGDGLAGWVAAHREPLLLNAVNDDPRWRSIPGLDDDIQSALSVPILSGDRLLGVISVLADTAGAFEVEQLDLMTTLSQQVSIAMENARLYDELKHALDERQAAQAQLIQSEKMAALGRLIASLAHEINNPLQSVQSCLTLAEEELDGVQRVDKMRRYLNVAETEIERIAAIVRRMRDFYRPAHTGMQPTDIQAVLQSVLELTAKQLQHSRVIAQLDCAADLPRIPANADYLKQVFLNLLLNAIDAMPDGGTLTLRTRLDSLPPSGDRPPRPAVRIEFSDTGMGMPPDVLSRLFEPFFTTKENGSGLGLSVSYGIIQSHRGQIDVVSQVNAGSTFSLLLPINPGE
jgi:PAS domain S-box-containing protein